MFKTNTQFNKYVDEEELKKAYQDAQNKKMKDAEEALQESKQATDD